MTKILKKLASLPLKCLELPLDIGYKVSNLTKKKWLSIPGAVMATIVLSVPCLIMSICLCPLAFLAIFIGGSITLVFEPCFEDFVENNLN